MMLHFVGARAARPRRSSVTKASPSLSNVRGHNCGPFFGVLIPFLIADLFIIQMVDALECPPLGVPGVKERIRNKVALEPETDL